MYSDRKGNGQKPHPGQNLLD